MREKGLDVKQTLVAVALAAGVMAASASPAVAQEAEPALDTYPMYFPLIGDYPFTDNFGEPRGGGRTHDGIDIMAPKMTPVVAAASGTVSWMHDGTEKTCCALELLHDDGWASRYIHLNNDTPGTDDGLGWGFAEGIEVGARVTAGSLIGWVGDSGNAEWTGPHLHFELHGPDGTVINPYQSLLAAIRVEAPLPAVWVPPFVDDDGSVHEPDIITIYEAGITNGCAQERYCPQDPVTRSQMAAFLLRMLEPEPEGEELSHSYHGYFDDVYAAEWYAAYVERLFEQAITRGCATDPLRYCPAQDVTRAEMAAFLVRALQLPEGQPVTFEDAAGHYFEREISALAAAEITQGCSETEFCPEDPVTRAQMASFLARALGLVSPSSE
jgi:murein DD-endopeptidase MepM/ murein hydrolase activator NlpD